MSAVEIRGVCKAFGGNAPVLDDISFSVADGEFVSLLGASGCGKTTLLRTIAGLESADAGALFIGGREVTGLAPKDRDIAMVFQNYALYPHLNVAENIGMGLKLRATPAAEIKRRVSDAAGKLGLGEYLERKPAALSGGQRQRVALARALVRQPSVFLLDEPLSNLDAVLREKTRGELKLLFRKLRGTVVYVTHDQIEAMTLSDRIVVMDGGRIQQIGTPQEIYGRPANVFVASFLGSPPMNMLPLGRVLELGLVGSTPAAPPETLCGIRPEDINVLTESREGSKEVSVILSEPTGSATILTLALGQGEAVTLRALVPSSWDQGRGGAWIACGEDKMHLFDFATKKRILPGPRS